MPWQQNLANLAFEIDPKTNCLAYGMVIVTVPRQSGKTTLVLAKNVQRMIDAAQLGGRQRIIYTAQDKNRAVAKLRDEFVPELQGVSRLKRHWRWRGQIGSEALIWKNNSMWEPMANKPDSGHGIPIDIADVDEAFRHRDDRAETAFYPAMATRNNSQFWVISTAGDETSLYLKQKVDQGRKLAEEGAQSGVCYVEFSADPEADPEDPATWYSCMPALGYTQTEDKVAMAFTSMTLQGFCRSYLNLWLPSNFGKQVIPKEDWQACEDADSEIAEDSEFFVSVDVGPESSWGSIAVAGYRDDGLPHGEILANEPNQDWIVDWLVKFRNANGKFKVALDPAGPAGALVAELRKKKFDVVGTSLRDVTQACASLLAKSKTREWRHSGNQRLSDALAGAAKKTVNDGWAWKRTSSSCDISPLVALTLALWMLDNSPEKPKYSDEDILASVG